MRTPKDFEKMFRELGITPAQNQQASPEEFARGFKKCTILKNTNITYSSGATVSNANRNIDYTGNPLTV